MEQTGLTTFSATVENWDFSLAGFNNSCCLTCLLSSCSTEDRHTQQFDWLARDWHHGRMAVAQMMGAYRS